MSINKVILVGNVGKDPDIRYQPSGVPVASFSLATSESWKDKNGLKNESVEWHKVVVFSEGICNLIKQYVRKGSKLYIEGKIKTRKWTDQNGVERYTTEIVLSGFDCKFEMLNRVDGVEQSYNSQDEGGQRGGTTSSPTPDLDDDIPF